MEDLKEALVMAAKEIYKRGLVQDGEGNLSIRIPGKDEMIITPTADIYMQLTKEDLVHINFDGTVISGNRKPSSEYKLHVAVYKHRKNAGCVIHTHSPYAMAFSIARKGIPVIIEEMVPLIGGDIRVADFAPAGSKEIGENAVKAMEGRNAVLLANHGAVVTARNILYGIKTAELVEKIAKVYYISSRIGKPQIIGKKEQERFKKMFELYFSTL